MSASHHVDCKQVSEILSIFCIIIIFAQGSQGNISQTWDKIE